MNKDELAAWEPLEDAVPRDLFLAEVRAWAKRIGVEPHDVRLRTMTRKWASCSSKGNLTFDTGLTRQSSAFRAEAVVHELLHLKVPNHGQLFTALLKSYLAEARAE